MAEANTDTTPGSGARDEHRWLQRLVGEWTFEGEAVMAPDQAPSRFAGSETVRSIGGLWVVGEGRMNTGGGETSTTILTLGYDPHRGRFVGTFVASMMTHLWVYDGALDAAGKVLTLDTEGPDGQGGMAKFHDVITLESDDHRVLTSQALTPEGSWFTFMTAHYRRTS